MSHVNAINIIQIIKGFLTDVADVCWVNHGIDPPAFAGEKGEWAIGTFPRHLNSKYRIHVQHDLLSIDCFDDIEKPIHVVFTLNDQYMTWVHDGSSWNKKCDNINKINFADAKCFEHFITIICLYMNDIKISRFILNRIINKPKYRSMFKEGRMRYIRRKMVYALDCEEISNLLSCTNLK